MKGNILVTGATGFTGANMVGKLLTEGAAIVTIQRDFPRINSLQALGLADRVSYVHGDILNYDLVERVIADYDVNYVFHLAAHTIVARARKSPVSVFMTNSIGTLHVLEACRKVGVDGVLVASTDKVYGDQPTLPTPEDAQLLGAGPYEASKVSADVIARSYREEFDVPLVVTRAGNIFGPADLNSRIVPNTIRQCIEGKRPVIFSESKDMQREYLYVDDAVAAYPWLLEQRESLDEYVYNVGTGEVKTQEAVVHAIASHFDLEPRYTEETKKHVEIDKQAVDWTRLEGLGWNPRWSFEEGLKETVAWYRRHAETLWPEGAVNGAT